MISLRRDELVQDHMEMFTRSDLSMHGLFTNCGALLQNNIPIRHDVSVTANVK